MKLFYGFLSAVAVGSVQRAEGTEQVHLLQKLRRTEIMEKVAKDNAYKLETKGHEIEKVMESVQFFRRKRRRGFKRRSTRTSKKNTKKKTKQKSFNINFCLPFGTCQRLPSNNWVESCKTWLNGCSEKRCGGQCSCDDMKLIFKGCGYQSCCATHDCTACLLKVFGDYGEQSSMCMEYKSFTHVFCTDMYDWQQNPYLLQVASESGVEQQERSETEGGRVNKIADALVIRAGQLEASQVGLDVGLDDALVPKVC